MNSNLIMDYQKKVCKFRKKERKVKVSALIPLKLNYIYIKHISLSYLNA